jgi:hypothetical protein
LGSEIVTTFLDHRGFVALFCILGQNQDHDGRRGDTAQALTQWRHPVTVTSSEALVDELKVVFCFSVWCFPSKLSTMAWRLLGGQLYAND